MTIVFIILGVTLLLFIWGRLRADLVALLSVLALYLTGILDTSQTLAGFGDATVIMIAALFVVGEGLSRTGVTAWLGVRIIALAGSSRLRMLVVLMVGTALLSAFISNTGTVATLLPATVSAAWTVGGVPSMFLIPLAFAANTGGLLTLTGTPPNIVVAEALSAAGLPPFGYFEYALIGLPLLVTAVVYMATVGQRLLPRRTDVDRPADLTREVSRLADSFDLEDDLFSILVRGNQQLIGRTLEELALGREFKISVMTVEQEGAVEGEPLDRRRRRRRRMLERVRQLPTDREFPGPDTVVRENDILLVKATAGAMDRAQTRFSLRYEPVRVAEDELPDVLLSHEVGLAEVLLAPRSVYIGMTVAQANFAARFRVQVLSVRRGDRRVIDPKARLAYGDALLVRGSWEAIDLLRNERRNFVVVGDPDALSRQVVELNRPAIVAVTALAGMIVLMAFSVIPTVFAALLAAAVMVLGRCLTMEQAYRAINWQSVVLIAAMIPLSTALTVTGGASFIASGLVSSLGSYGPGALMAGVFLLTTAFSQVINNTATAVLITPIVMQAAVALGVSPYPLLMTVAVSASTAFLTPIGTTTNLMVMTPGGYRFTDYARVGGPLLLLFLVITLILGPVIWPF